MVVMVSQIYQAKQFKVAAKNSKCLQESLELRNKSLISNLTLKIESPVFKNCISLQCFQQEVSEFDTITSIKPE